MSNDPTAAVPIERVKITVETTTGNETITTTFHNLRPTAPKAPDPWAQPCGCGRPEATAPGTVSIDVRELEDDLAFGVLSSHPAPKVLDLHVNGVRLLPDNGETHRMTVTPKGSTQAPDPAIA